MKIAIVGSSKLTTREEEAVVELCEDIIKSCMEECIIISGGANGVDTVAAKTCKMFGLKPLIFYPEKQTWEFFKKRNLKIAQECDQLYCISTKVKSKICYHHKEPQDHEKTAGCWTMNKALTMGKRCRFFKV